MRCDINFKIQETAISYHFLVRTHPNPLIDPLRNYSDKLRKGHLRSCRHLPFRAKRFYNCVRRRRFRVKHAPPMTLLKVQL
ncbi:hypothetical protein L596_017643 [Steinernema carpocapsae]|uniref:Uncharacterized protein n=1 Tax=Steinernema carpocapsae TaxID=34508 RepID=A0A4U5N294_STECR|nr:hypothetical protein L596_017643 [Steinernema carpocapsae]